MNRLNPIYIIVLLVVLSLVSFMLLDEKKKEFNSSVKDVQALKLLGNEYRVLKTNWRSKRSIENRLNSILNNSSFRNVSISKSFERKKFLVSAKTNNARTLNNLLNKILNEKFLIRKLEIKPTELKVEIGI